MITQIRETQFGQLARLVSNARWLKYPDELDTSIWQKSVPQAGASDLGRKKNRGSSNDDTEQEPGWADDAVNNSNVFIVGWYGPDDIENPRNWSSGWKITMLLQICLFNFSVYMGSSIYVPGELSLMEDFHVSETVATLGLSLFTLGYGLGPMLWSPLSEIPSIGRRSIYFWTMLAFVLLQLPCGFAVNMPMFCIFRFLAGFFGSPCLATGGATITDTYSSANAAYGICIWGSFGILGPVFGPIIGGFTASAKGWRWTIWILTYLCTFTLLLMTFLLPETSASNILHRRAARLRAATRNPHLKSRSEISSSKTSSHSRFPILTAFRLTFTEPIVFFMDLYTALLYGVLFIWFESFPFVFGDIYHFSLSAQGLMFLGIFVGAIISVPLFLLWVKHGIVSRFDSPDFKPEMVLPPTVFGAIALPVCLFWYGWTSRANVHWIVPIIGSGFFTVAIVTLFNPILNYLGIAYPDFAASTFAGNALFRASFGAIFPLFARQLFRRLGVGPGNSLLGGIAVLFAPIPWVFWRYGVRLRGMSRNARHD